MSRIYEDAAASLCSAILHIAALSSSKVKAYMVTTEEFHHS